jgi:hypothetical protein
MVPHQHFAYDTVLRNLHCESERPYLPAVQKKCNSHRSAGCPRGLTPVKTEKWHISRIIQKHSYPYSLLTQNTHDESQPDSPTPYMAQHARRHVSDMARRPQLTHSVISTLPAPQSRSPCPPRSVPLNLSPSQEAR